MSCRRRNLSYLFLAVLVIALPLCSAFTPPALTIDFGSHRVTITDQILRNGWYNYHDQQQFTHGKSIWSRALAVTDPANFAGAFPDIVHYLDRVTPQYELAPYDGQVNFHPHQTPQFTVTNQQPGRQVDREQLYQDLLAALKGHRFPVITAQYRTVAPTDPATILANIVTRSTFSTRCQVNPSRENNIALALAKFDGLIINPGEEVSFNQIVGQRTSEQGFQTAKIIINGEYVDGIGGGVCQVSTTIFNAVAQAGLQINENHHHSLPSSYVPLGHDAMVSSHADLRFTNNTGRPVYLTTQFQHHQLTVTIYGRPKGDHVRYQLATETVKTIAPKDTYDPDLSAATIQDAKQHPDHYQQTLQKAGQPGYVVNTYLETYQGSRRLSKKLLRRATYQATPNQYTLTTITQPTDPDTSPDPANA